MQTLKLPHNFTPRPYQKPLMDYIEAGGKNAIVILPRRHGKDLTVLHTITREMMHPDKIGTYAYYFPTLNGIERSIWVGKTTPDEEDSRNGEKSIPFLMNAIPEVLRESINNTKMRMHLKHPALLAGSNDKSLKGRGSTLVFGHTSDPEKIEGAGFRGVVLSEFSFMENIQAVNKALTPMVGQSGGFVIRIYTPNGNNHGKKIYELNKNNPDWFVQKMDITETCKAPWYFCKKEDWKSKCPTICTAQPVTTIAQVEKELREGTITEEDIPKTYYSSFDAPASGSFYGEAMNYLMDNDKIGHYPYDPTYPVHTAWDLGLKNLTVIWFFQLIQGETRIIDYHEDRGKRVTHYASVVKDKDYTYGQHLLPHDAIHTHRCDLSTDVVDLARHGIKATVVPRGDKLNGIKATANYLYKCCFDELSTRKGVGHLKDYAAKKDTLSNGFTDIPKLKQESEDACDAFRMLVMGIKLIRKEYRTEEKKVRQTRVKMNYRMYNRGNKYGCKNKTS